MSTSWKLVPTEPTEEMCRASCTAMFRAPIGMVWEDVHAACFKAALAVAPPPPPEGLPVAGWQRIDTAPTGDEADVLLWTPSGMCVGYTLDGRTWHPSGVTALDDGGEVLLFDPPSHWAPLPAAPVGAVSTLGVDTASTFQRLW